MSEIWAVHTGGRIWHRVPWDGTTYGTAAVCGKTGRWYRWSYTRRAASMHPCVKCAKIVDAARQQAEASREGE